MICYDRSENSVTITDPTGWYVWNFQIKTDTADGPYPTRGWMTPDANCNSVSNATYGWILQWQVGSLYNQNNKLVTLMKLYFGAPTPSPWWVGIVPQTATDYLAWYANSNTGYECVFIP